jgi:hypothetical protein
LPRAEYNPRSTYGIAKDRVPACARAPPVWTPSHGHAWNRPDHIVLRVVLLCRARSTTAPRLHLAPRCSAQQWPSCSCDCGGLKRSRRIGQIRCGRCPPVPTILSRECKSWLVSHLLPAADPIALKSTYRITPRDYFTALLTATVPVFELSLITSRVIACTVCSCLRFVL